MMIDERNPGDEASPDALKKVALLRLPFDLVKRVPDQFHGVMEDDLKESFLGPEVLKHRTLGNPQTLHHAVDAGLAKTMAGEFIDCRLEYSFPLVAFEILESLAKNH